MRKILYMPPYSILFGHISLDKPKLEKNKDDNKFKKNIDNYFYDGFLSS